MKRNQHNLIPIGKNEIIKYFKTGMSMALSYQLLYYLPFIYLGKGTAFGIKHLVLRLVHNFFL